MKAGGWAVALAAVAVAAAAQGPAARLRLQAEPPVPWLAAPALEADPLPGIPVAPGDEALRQALGLLERERPFEAAGLLRSVIRREPDNAVARAATATALIQARRHREARDLLEAMMEKRPDDFALRNNLAWLLATSGEAGVRDPARATELARDALLAMPGDYHIWSTLAEAHYAAGDYNRAVRAALEALRLAAARGAPPAQAATYQQQADRSRRALEAFSLFE